MKGESITSLKLSGRHYYILLVSSMEQIIGAGLSTIAGVIIPMIALVAHPDLNAVMQGAVGAIGLIGIAVGSAVIGKISESQGYLLWFRLSPVLIILGSALVYLFPSIPGLMSGLFIAGFGVGGGYALDSTYISELMPAKWKLFMVGVAKGACALGFLGVAVACFIILRNDPDPHIWNRLTLTLAVLGVITLLMRLHWAESPHWLIAHGKTDEAQKAAEFFFGKDITVTDIKIKPAEQKVSWSSMFKGNSLRQIILTGVPWACEGLGVYGFGVFLPVLIMALGLSDGHQEGMSKIINSLEYTSVVNFFILPGFILGLMLVNRMSHIKMLSGGFLICSVGLVVLLAAYIFKLPVWVSVLGFIVFELFLNAGPHLVTFILPSQVFPEEVRSAGSGIAAMIGKVGAVLGVVVMPLMLRIGGMILVLVFSIFVQLAGAWVASHYSRNVVEE